MLKEKAINELEFVLTISISINHKNVKLRNVRIQKQCKSITIRQVRTEKNMADR